MAIETWIKFDGIEGEATHKDHKNEVAVLSWSWGLTNASGGSAGGAGTGRATPQDLHIVHSYDKASPILAKKAAQGQRIPTAVLSTRRSGEGQKDFLKITMKEVIITSVQASASSEGVMEQVAMAYTNIDFSYSPQTSTGGAGAPVAFGWNVKTNKVT
jgi:type VI secretion system secreted protein Hcp